MKYVKESILKVLSLIAENKKSIKPLFFLFLIFGLLKSLVYISPLAINEIVNSIKSFGEFEYSLNLGQTLTGVFSMGFAGAYAYFVLKNNQKQLKPIFHLHFVIITTALLGACVIIPNLLNNLYFGSMILGVTFADQLFLSSVLKIKGKNKTAVTIDSGVYLAMTLFVILLYFNLIKYSLAFWFGLLLFLLVVTTVFYHIPNLKHFRKLKRNNYWMVYKYGFLIVIASPLLLLITGNTRLYIGYFTNYEDVGLYSFYFRLSSIVFILSRVFGIMLYRRMFMDTHNQLDKYYSLISIIYFLFNTAVFLFLPLFLNGKYDFFTNTFDSNKGLFLLCLFQATFWIHTSFFEPILQRENKMLWFVIVLIIVVVLMILTLSSLHYLNYLTLNSIVVINTFFIFILFLGQQFILKKINVIYKRTLTVHIVIGFLFFVSIIYYNI